MQDFKTLICMNSDFKMKCVVHDTDTAKQVNHFQNFIAKVSKLSEFLILVKKNYLDILLK